MVLECRWDFAGYIIDSVIVTISVMLLLIGNFHHKIFSFCLAQIMAKILLEKILNVFSSIFDLQCCYQRMLTLALECVIGVISVKWVPNHYSVTINGLSSATILAYSIYGYERISSHLHVRSTLSLLAFSASTGLAFAYPAWSVVILSPVVAVVQPAVTAQKYYWQEFLDLGVLVVGYAIGWTCQVHLLEEHQSRQKSPALESAEKNAAINEAV